MWTAPTNTTGIPQQCTIQVAVSDGTGLSQVGSYFQEVTQGVASCSYSLSSTSKSFFPTGGSASVNVAAPPGCSWTAVSNDAWITITSVSSSDGNGTVNYSVAPYNGASQRSGTMTLAEQTFTITQDGVGLQCGTGAFEESADWTLMDEVVTGIKNYRATHAIEVGPAYTITASGCLSLTAGGPVIFHPGFRVEQGGRLEVNISESTSSPILADISFDDATDTIINNGTLPFGGGNNAKTAAFLQLDYSELPAQATTAVLRLHVVNRIGGGVCRANVMTVKAGTEWEWTEESFTFEVEQAGAALLQTETPVAQQAEWWEIDITAAYNQSPNGLMIVGISTDGCWIEVASSEHTDASLRPQVVVE